MKINFHKYEGGGNDFVLIDNRNNDIILTNQQIELMCDRRFGIGGDGLMLLEKSSNSEFKMVYYNADGNESSFCGNGGRCIAHYAHHMLQITEKGMEFEAMDGLHQATILEQSRVALSMRPVKEISFFDDYTILDTGSPHFVKKVNHLTEYPVFEEGRKIRNWKQFQPKGINVNFWEEKEHQYYIRTYERGVENETYACGTGITATAIATVGDAIGAFSIGLISKKGHRFLVSFVKNQETKADNIILEGPVKNVFQGVIEIS